MASQNKRKEQECKYREKLHKYTKYAQVHHQSATEMNRTVTIIIMISYQKHDMISLSFVLMNNRVEEEKNMMIMTNR